MTGFANKQTGPDTVYTEHGVVTEYGVVTEGVSFARSEVRFTCDFEDLVVWLVT